MFPPTELFGIHTHGMRKPTYFSLISRKTPKTSQTSNKLLTCSIRVGVGFSYADYGETIETTETASKNIHAFITIFFETFSQFSGRPLHLSGESYGVSVQPLQCIHKNIRNNRGDIYRFLRARFTIRIKSPSVKAESL